MKPSYATIAAALTLPALSLGLCTAANANEIDFQVDGLQH